MITKKETKWKKSYSWLLIANIIFILAFYLIMEIFS
jgi:hypothetical protein